MVDIFFQIIFDNFEYPVANHLEKERQMFLNNPNQGYTVYLFFSPNDSRYFFEKDFFSQKLCMFARSGNICLGFLLGNWGN